MPNSFFGKKKTRITNTDTFVSGVSVRTKGVFADFGADLKDEWVGGKSTVYRNMYHQAVQEAVDDLITNIPDGCTIGEIQINTPTFTNRAMAIVVAYARVYPYESETEQKEN